MEESPSQKAASSHLPKKKRGRPKKAATTQPISGADTAQSNWRENFAGGGSAGKRRQSSGASSAFTASNKVPDSDVAVQVPGSDGSRRPADVNVGQKVHGVVDGMFDAGYLVTIRVGATDTLLRGVVFDPGFSVPLGSHDDIAPARSRMSQEAPAASAADHRTSHPRPAAPSLQASSDSSSNPSVPLASPSAAIEEQRAESAPALTVARAALPPPLPASGLQAYIPGPVSYRSSPFPQIPLHNDAVAASFYSPPTSSPTAHLCRPSVACNPPSREYVLYQNSSSADYPVESSPLAHIRAASVSPSPSSQGAVPPHV